MLDPGQPRLMPRTTSCAGGPLDILPRGRESGRSDGMPSRYLWEAGRRGAGAMGDPP